MKSRTSFFNAIVLKKDITRFAPVWALYTLFLIVMFLSCQPRDSVLIASSIRELNNTISAVNLIYGGLCANILFGDLFQSRMCNALHAMPLRRDGWFLTHCCAGLLFSALPNLLGTLLYLVLLQEYWYIAFFWLIVAVCSFLFFFGLGTFSVMCAGNRLGMIAVYGIINFFSVLVYVLVTDVYEPLLYGFEFVAEPFLFCCPVYYLCKNQFLTFNYDYVADRFVNGRIESFHPEVWWYLIVLTLIGVALAGLALLLYRKRKLEYAGDFLAIKALEPVFLIIYTLAFSVFFHILSSLFGFATHNLYLFMVIGAVVGFFTGQMFLKRTVRVFQKRSFLGFAVFAAVLIASLVIAKLDPLRITWYAPELDEIAYMQVYQDGDRHRFTESYQLDTPQEIETLRDVHCTLMGERQAKTDGRTRLYVRYTLKNGRVVTRYYLIDEHTAAYDTLQKHFSSFQYLFGCDSWDTLSNGAFTSLSVDYYKDYAGGEYSSNVSMELNDINVGDREKIQQFMEALRKDCEAGNMAQSYTFHLGENPLAWCYLSAMLKNEQGIIISNGERFQELSIYPSAVHTTALLEQWVVEAQQQTKG